MKEILYNFADDIQYSFSVLTEQLDDAVNTNDYPLIERIKALTEKLITNINKL